MNIDLITPAPETSRAGNRVTAERWARLLGGLGHRVRLATAYDEADAQAMIALHAWRSAGAVAAFRARHPDRPLILALTGTDIYRFLESEPETTLGAIERADVLVGLHDRVAEAIPARFHARLRIIYQSAAPLGRRPPTSHRHFDVCVVGHLRDEKDPFRAARAARDLAADSRLRVTHLGAATAPCWAAAARAEMAANPRYRWRGEVGAAQVRRLLSETRLMVLSSVLEGGANVLSEAIVARIPVLASDIPGNRGLLGDDYPGYFPPRETARLGALLRRAETEPDFLGALHARVAARAPRFREPAERAAWKALLDGLSRPG